MEHKHDIIWYETLDSTNSEAARRADSLDNLSVIAARCQTAGRGQKGNRWISDADLNLTFSIFLRFDTTAAGSGKDFPQIKATDQFMISETATLAQCRLLEAYGIDARIKWPNDIYVGNRKISGMLVENTLEGKWLKTSIVGIGLNVNQVTFPADLPNPVSMRRCSGKKYDADALLVRFMDFFAEEISRLRDLGGMETLRQEYESLLYRSGETALFADLSGRPAYLPADPVAGCGQDDSPYPVFKGRITGVTENGLLLVELESGEMKQFGFKEIAYIIR